MGIERKKITKSLIQIAGCINKPVEQYLKSKAKRKNVAYARYYKQCRVQSHTVLYESFYGRGMLCNPLAIFNVLLHDPKYKHFKHIWVLDDLSQHQDLIQKYKPYKNVRFVQHDTRAYLKALCTAKYLVNNSTFLSYFVKKPEQVYINTWHGIPLKHMGYDQPHDKVNVANTVRNFLQTDYLISANSLMDDMYLKAYKLDGLFEGKILQSGYPRLDTTVHSKREEVVRELRNHGVKVEDGKKIVLYAPTWKGNDFYNPDCDIEDYIALKKQIEQKVGEDYQVLIKVHQVVYKYIKDEIDQYDYIVPATVDANVVLSVADVLISDYSSIFFDYLVTGRPVLFYIPNVNSYKKNRGLNLTLEELPGPYTDRSEEIAKWLADVETACAGSRERYEKMRAWCCPEDAGQISKKIVQAVFEGKAEAVPAHICANTKKKILFVQGNMAVNGMTSALMNLLEEIDYDQYDVTLYVNFKEQSQQKNADLVDSRVRLIARTGISIATLCEDMRMNLYNRRGYTKFWKAFCPKKVYEREFRRCVGASHFDYVIDYDGYNIFYSTLALSGGTQAVTCIWCHNDMQGEMEVKFPWLKKIFTLYSLFDKVVSCSKEIMEVNRKNLATPESYDHFTYAKNAVNYKKVLHGLEKSRTTEKDGKLFYLQRRRVDGDSELKYVPLQPIRQDKLHVDGTVYTVRQGSYDQYSIDVLRVVKAKEQTRTFSEDGICIRFMTVGRLSPEKNYEALIRAFSDFLEKGYNAMLYLIGDGPLHEEIDALIESLGVRERVVMVGLLENPSELLKYADCFLLTSLHEGQPVVVHEARVAGLPIIMTRFSSYIGSSVSNGQYLIGMEQADILEGLEAFAAGKVPKDYVYDYVNNNREAYHEFLSAIGE